MLDLGFTLHWMLAKCAPGPDGRLSRDLPPAFAAVLRRCLEPDSARPFTRPSEVAEALNQALRSEQEKTETATTRTKMVISPGSRPPQPAAAPAPAPAPQSQSPAPSGPPRGPLQPVVRHDEPTFLQRMDAFVWKAFSTGLHLLISLVGIGGLVLLILFKDKIIVEKDDFLPRATVAEMEQDVDDKPIPAAVLGALPPPPSLPVTPVAVKPVTLPPAPVATDPFEDLRTQYVAAVQTAANHALEKVSLDDLPHLQRELQLLQSGGEVPEVDEPNLPASLKALRQRYREVRAGKVTTSQ